MSDETEAGRRWMLTEALEKRARGAAPDAVPDAVNHPPYYATLDPEPITVIEAWGLGFHAGNALKYVARAGRKDPAKLIEDLEKAVWYLSRWIAKLKAGR